jgi:hypothetical protein
MQVIKAALRKCANDNPTEWHIYVSGICSDIRNNMQESIGMSPYKALFGREPILPAEMRFPTLNTLVRPDLDMEETAEQRQSRFEQMEISQSICKAHILGAQRVQTRNFARWSQNEKTRYNCGFASPWGRSLSFPGLEGSVEQTEGSDSRRHRPKMVLSVVSIAQTLSSPGLCSRLFTGNQRNRRSRPFCGRDLTTLP